MDSGSNSNKKLELNEPTVINVLNNGYQKNVSTSKMKNVATNSDLFKVSHEATPYILKNALKFKNQTENSDLSEEKQNIAKNSNLIIEPSPSGITRIQISHGITQTDVQDKVNDLNIKLVKREEKIIENVPHLKHYNTEKKLQFNNIDDMKTPEIFSYKQPNKALHLEINKANVSNESQTKACQENCEPNKPAKTDQNTSPIRVILNTKKSEKTLIPNKQSFIHKGVVCFFLILYLFISN